MLDLKRGSNGNKFLGGWKLKRGKRKPTVDSIQDLEGQGKETRIFTGDILVECDGLNSKEIVKKIMDFLRQEKTP